MGIRGNVLDGGTGNASSTGSLGVPGQKTKEELLKRTTKLASTKAPESITRPLGKRTTITITPTPK